MTASALATELLARDRGLVWHPYAPLDGPALYAVEHADGVRLDLRAVDGARFDVIDAMSSWWCAIHGYRNPVLDAALAAQAQAFSHVMFGGLTHEPAVRLAEELVARAPEGLRHVFLADSGSVAVEVSLKLAVQYQAALGRTHRRRLIALRGAYHGDTAGAMGVCDPVDGMHSLFPGLVAEQRFLPRPPAFAASADEVGRWVAEAEVLVEGWADEAAAIIVEPVLQGAGGMWTYAPGCLVALRELADRHGLLMIADEIATGFARTGRRWGCDWAGVIPDVMCVGKALTGGYLSLAAMLCTSAVADVIAGSPQRALLHGPTFMANPLACAVASASMSLLDEERFARVGEIEAELRAGLAPAEDLSSVTEVRVLGAVGVLQLRSAVDVAALTRAALRRGVWLRPFRDLVYTMPPYVCTPDDVSQIASAICGAVEEVHG